MAPTDMNLPHTLRSLPFFFSGPVRNRLSTIVGSWWLRFAIVVLFGWAVQDLYWQRIHYTGDEPHYMMSAVSFLHDGDFNLANNYRQNDQQRYAGWPGLTPQLWKAQEDPNVIPSAHGTIFPIIIAPAYKWDRIFGVRYFTIAISAVAIFVTAWLTDLLTGNRLIGTLALCLLTFSPTWEMQASRTYPETLAALLTMLAFVLLARGPTSFASMLLLGFMTAFLPVLYTKYVAIAAGLGLVIVLLPDVRRKPAVWLGMTGALAIGVWNRICWGGEGAQAGDFWKSMPDAFAVDGMFDRVWRPFLDRDHGLWPYQPFMILVIWAVFYTLRFPKTRQQCVLCGVGLVCLLYTGMHAVWKGVPGHGVPGRYLAAAVPAFCICLAIWATQVDELRPARVVVLFAGLAITGILYYLSFQAHLPQYEVAMPYRMVWPRYFESWEVGSASQIVPVGKEGIYWFIAVLLSKAAAYIWLDRHGVRPQSNPVRASSVAEHPRPQAGRSRRR